MLRQVHPPAPCTWLYSHITLTIKHLNNWALGYFGPRTCKTRENWNVALTTLNWETTERSSKFGIMPSNNIKVWTRASNNLIKFSQINLNTGRVYLYSYLFKHDIETCCKSTTYFTRQWEVLTMPGGTKLAGLQNFRFLSAALKKGNFDGW